MGDVGAGTQGLVYGRQALIELYLYPIAHFIKYTLYGSPRQPSVLETLGYLVTCPLAVFYFSPAPLLSLCLGPPQLIQGS